MLPIKSVEVSLQVNVIFRSMKNSGVSIPGIGQSENKTISYIGQVKGLIPASNGPSDEITRELKKDCCGKKQYQTFEDGSFLRE